MESFFFNPQKNISEIGGIDFQIINKANKTNDSHSDEKLFASNNISNFSFSSKKNNLLNKYNDLFTQFSKVNIKKEKNHINILSFYDNKNCYVNNEFTYKKNNEFNKKKKDDFIFNSINSNK